MLQLKNKAKNISILYVEDEAEVRDRTVGLLNKLFSHIDVAFNGEEGLEKYLQNSYDIVITDILMPKMNGLELISHIREKNKKQEIIVISAYTDSEYLTQSIRLGVTGYIIKPVDINQMMDIFEQSIDKLIAFRENEMYKTELESMVEDRTRTVLQLQEELIDNYEHAIKSLVKMIEDRDTYTGGHSERVAAYSRDIAKEMGLDDKECELIYRAAILHDIGKVVAPDSILLKPGKLTEKEYLLVQEHVKIGYKILSEIPMYQEIAKIVYAHHEHYDGSGYPQGLKGEEIPIYARIMSIADTFDAMTTSRIYKSRKSVSEAITDLSTISSSSYDPHILKSAIKVLKSVTLDKSITQAPNTLIDEERFAYFYKDMLTGAYNQSYLDFILQKNQNEQKSTHLHVLYLKNFSAYNRLHGWKEGDQFLQNFYDYLQSNFSDFKIFRIFGDDFVLLQDRYKELDIDKINNLPILKEVDLSVKYNYFDAMKSKIISFHDLEENI